MRNACSYWDLPLLIANLSRVWVIVEISSLWICVSCVEEITLMVKWFLLWLLCPIGFSFFVFVPLFFRAGPCKCKSLQLSADESTGSEPVFERSESGIDGCRALWPWMHCSVGHLASAGGAAPRTTLMNERETVRHERRDDTRRLTAHCLLWCPN